MGYEKIRETILAKQKEMGILPENTELSPINPLGDMTSVDGKPIPPGDLVRPWDSLSDDEKKLFVRMAEVYAGYCTYTDHEIGRLIDYLEATGELDNTLIVRHLRQRRLGRRRSERLGQREQVLQQRAGRHGRQPDAARQARLARNLQPLPDRLGDGVQHALQAVQALDLGRRRLRPDDRALAQGHQSQGRAARPVHPLHRHRADRL